MSSDNELDGEKINITNDFNHAKTISFIQRLAKRSIL